MSDDAWKQGFGREPGPTEREMDSFDDDEYGGPLFGDTAETSTTRRSGAVERIKLDADDSGALPHWTAAATGEVPRIEPTTPKDPTDDLDVWSSFTTESPVWNEGDPVDAAAPRATPPVDTTGELTWEDSEPSGSTAVTTESARDTGAVSTTDAATTMQDAVAPARREPARITIGTDPSGMPRRPDPRRRGAAPQRPPRAGGPQPGPDGRNLPLAVATGLLLAAVFLGLTLWSPAGSMTFVAIALGLAAIEYFVKVSEKGYRPAVAAGVAACVAAPLAVYWVGESALPLVIFFAFLASALSFVAADSVESGPMPNMAITMLGVVWIGVLGSFAALILRWSTFSGGTDWGTDTLILVAIGVVVNDIGAYFVGSAFGRTPLRAWISPGKSIEGFLGGAIVTLVVMFVISLGDYSDTWSDTVHLLWLGIVISLAAPLGDLTESMFKRNLDIKDFGGLIRGHGGVLDRFDGFLFALPAVYYLFLVLEPWTAFSG
jgi:phosphatidate cytidylyltransferase